MKESTRISTALTALALGLSLCVISTGTAFADTAAAVEEADEELAAFPWVSEELYYSVRINGAEAMRAGVRAGTIRRREGRAYVPINGMARSRGFFHAVYPLDDRINTFLDAHSFRPLHSEKVFNENGRLRTYVVDYLHQNFEAQVERIREDRSTRFNSPIPGSTHDMLTWMYELRREGQISMGDEFSYYIYDGWLLSRLDLVVVGREDLLTPMGWFRTWKLSFSREIMVANRTSTDEEDSASPPDVSLQEAARHTGHLWLSRDENLLPVRFTIDTMLGAGEAVLIRYQPAPGR